MGGLGPAVILFSLVFVGGAGVAAFFVPQPLASAQEPRYAVKYATHPRRAFQTAQALSKRRSCCVLQRATANADKSSDQVQLDYGELLSAQTITAPASSAAGEPIYDLDNDTTGGKPLVVGLAGGTGSGKSTMKNIILEQLVRLRGGLLSDEVATLSHDNYYKHRPNLSDEERDKINFDHPDSLETDLMVSHLQLLLDGHAVECPVYDFATHLRKENETLRVEPRPIILVEGILIFTNQALREKMNLKIYVDVEADRRILRRIERDLVDRGRSFASIVSQYLETVKPMHDQYVEPSKQFADLIVPHGAQNVAAIQVLLERLRAHLRAHDRRRAQ